MGKRTVSTNIDITTAQDMDTTGREATTRTAIERATGINDQGTRRTTMERGTEEDINTRRRQIPTKISRSQMTRFRSQRLQRQPEILG
jgi:hypothetical protein